MCENITMVQYIQKPSNENGRFHSIQQSHSQSSKCIGIIIFSLKHLYQINLKSYHFTSKTMKTETTLANYIMLLSILFAFKYQICDKYLVKVFKYFL